jgi:hypothetical protein
LSSGLRNGFGSLNLFGSPHLGSLGSSRHSLGGRLAQAGTSGGLRLLRRLLVVVRRGGGNVSHGSVEAEIEQ